MPHIVIETMHQIGAFEHRMNSAIALDAKHALEANQAQLEALLRDKQSHAHRIVHTLVLLEQQVRAREREFCVIK